MQDWEIAQQIEDLIEVVDMELEPEPQDEDVDMIPSTPQITIQSPSPLATKPSLSVEGDIVSLDDDSVMDVYNLSYDGILQTRRNHLLDDHPSTTFIRERWIVVDISRNPNSIVEENLDFVGVTKSNTQYLTIMSKKLRQNLQVSQQEIEKLHRVAQNAASPQIYLGEISAEILGEVSTLGETI